jgi:hypothetical protein
VWITAKLDAILWTFAISDSFKIINGNVWYNEIIFCFSFWSWLSQLYSDCSRNQVWKPGHLKVFRTFLTLIYTTTDSQILIYLSKEFNGVLAKVFSKFQHKKSRGLAEPFSFWIEMTTKHFGWHFVFSSRFLVNSLFNERNIFPKNNCRFIVSKFVKLSYELIIRVVGCCWLEVTFTSRTLSKMIQFWICKDQNDLLHTAQHAEPLGGKIWSHFDWKFQSRRDQNPEFAFGPLRPKILNYGPIGISWSGSLGCAIKLIIHRILLYGDIKKAKNHYS